MILPAAAGLLLLTAACGGGEADDDHDDDDAAKLAGATVAQQFKVELLEIKFEPKELRFKAGEVVEIEFHNDGKLVHDFTIKKIDADAMAMARQEGQSGAMAAHQEEHQKDLALHMALEAGDHGTLRLRVHKAGQYEYYCTVAGHKDAGMVGKLIVSK
ncbi:MAG: hypothetical protein FJZ92_07520 [Chloroflexi bacterium]|nr:hypothetical protein [Chloroflexota bacterium]